MAGRHAGLALLPLLLLGCGAAGTPAAVQPTEARAPLVMTPTYTPTELAFASNLNPLLGLPSEDPEISRSSPMAYALKLAPAAAQLAGIQALEWVVEAPPAPAADGASKAESWSLIGITLRKPQTRPEIGPLDEAGELAVLTAEAFGATRLVALSASPEMTTRLAKAGVELLALSNEPGQPEPDTPLGREALSAHQLEFTELIPSGERVSALTLPQAIDRATVWRYDPVFGLWNRFQAIDDQLEALRDADTGEPLSTANLLLLELADAPAGSEGWTGQGPATLLRDGLAVAGSWQRGSGEALRLRDPSGAALALRPGNTWLLLVMPGAPRAFAP